MRVLILIPAHNEAGSIPLLLSEIEECGYDALVIDDASRDNTAEIAKQMGFPVITLTVNLGIGGGIQAGFIYAVRFGYDVVVQVDGDGQHNPADVSNVIRPILNNDVDCCIGSRYLPGSFDVNYVTPFARRLGMRFSSAILKLATGLSVYDTTSGFRALNKKAFSYFAQEYPVDHPEAEALLMLHQAGFRVAECPVRMRGRTSGQSLFTFLKAFFYPLRVIIGFIGIINLKPRAK
jgi:glycosyltransferase involved in cell wall biosynthesis